MRKSNFSQIVQQLFGFLLKHCGFFNIFFSLRIWTGERSGSVQRFGEVSEPDWRISRQKERWHLITYIILKIRTCFARMKEKIGLFGKKGPICDCSRTYQIP